MDSIKTHFVALSLFCAGPGITLAQGILDPSFGDGGISVVHIGGLESMPTSISVQPDGRILLTGRIGEFMEAPVPVLLRLLPDGPLDSAFAVDGKAIGPGSGQEYLGMLRRPNGRILTHGSSGAEGLIARYTAAGILDSTFGTNGLATNAVGYNDPVYDLALDADGNIVGVGSSYQGGIEQFIKLQRWLPNGTPDPTFSDDGVVTASAGLGTWTSGALLSILTDGRYLVAGSGGPFSNASTIFMRFNSDGSIDETFGVNGVVIVELGTSPPGIGDMFVDDLGRIVIAGSLTSQFMGADAYVARFLADGTPDNSFGANGARVIELPFDQYGKTVRELANGNLVLQGTGAIGSGSGEILLALCDANGQLIDGFGDGGFVVSTLPDLNSGGSMDLQPDGKIVVMYSLDNHIDGNDYLVARFLNDLNVSAPATDHTITSRVWPNPAQNLLHFTSDEPVIRTSLLEASGKLIRTFCPAERELDVHDLPSGAYLLEVITRSGRTMSPVIKR
jgi:uncharacterized delta-60 repeat protein